MRTLGPKRKMVNKRTKKNDKQFSEENNKMTWAKYTWTWEYGFGLLGTSPFL